MFKTWFQRQLNRRGMSQADFMRLAGISRSTVSEWWRGTRVPDPPSCDLIADALGLDIDDVLVAAGHRPNIEARNHDDPAELIQSMVRRVDFHGEPSRLPVLQSILEVWIDQDRARRTQGAVASPPSRRRLVRSP